MTRCFSCDRFLRSFQELVLLDPFVLMRQFSEAHLHQCFASLTLQVRSARGCEARSLPAEWRAGQSRNQGRVCAAGGPRASSSFLPIKHNRGAPLGAPGSCHSASFRAAVYQHELNKCFGSVVTSADSRITGVCFFCLLGIRIRVWFLYEGDSPGNTKSVVLKTPSSGPWRRSYPVRGKAELLP